MTGEKDDFQGLFEAELAQASTLLTNVQAVSLKNASDDWLEATASYVEFWAALGDKASDSGFLSLGDVIALYIDACSDFFENNAPLSAERWRLLHDWHQLFETFVQNPDSHQAASMLIECLTNDLWSEPLTREDVSMLLEQLVQSADKNIEIDDEQYSIPSIFKEVLDEVNSMLKKSHANMGSAEFVDIASQYADCWQVIAEKAGESGLLALQDTTALFAEGCSYLAEHKQDSREAVLRLWLDWHQAFEKYLKAAKDRERFVVLIECLKNPLWESPLSDDDSTMLLEMFGDESTGGADKSEKATSDKSEQVVLVQTAYVKPELLAMVNDEFALLVRNFILEADHSDENATDVATFKAILTEQEYKFETLAKACGTIGLAGLRTVFERLSVNMRSRRAEDPGFSEVECQLFKEALPLIQSYLEAVNDSERCQSLVLHLQSEGWKNPLLATEAGRLIEQLTQPVISGQDDRFDSRKKIAESEDVSLELPEDVNQELLDSLLNELPASTANFSSAIQRVVAGNRNIEDLLEAQRIAHTLKGSGNIVGISGIATLTHHLEEILEQLTEQGAFPVSALGNMLMEAADCLEMMSDALVGDGHAPGQAKNVLQKVLDWSNQIAVHGLPAENADLLVITPVLAESETQIDPVARSQKSAEATAVTRVPNTLVDKLLRMTGESSVLGEQFKERIDRFSDELKVLRDLTWQMQTLVSELDQFVNIQSYSTLSTQSGIDSEFDALEMDQYNELHTSASRIAEVATDIREINAGMERQLAEVKELMAEHDNIQQENQETIQSIRMVPASTISSRCQRIVRQAGRMTEKQVELEIKGEEIPIDSEILNNLVDPVMHLLRNAVDHGIEPVGNRKIAGKDEKGFIQLEYSRKGNYAIVKCRDDGAGLDSLKILQTAIKKGLIADDAQLTEAEINKLILIPGFSTRDTVTQVSGRGIGMDAIHAQVTAMQGGMTLSSEPGKGLEITLTIPLTLSSMQSLLVRSGGQILAVSNRGLQQIYHSESGERIQRNDEWVYRLENIETGTDEDYPLKYFRELIGMSNENLPDKKLPALRIEDESGETTIVVVDEILGYRDLLVKNMGYYIPNIPGVLGAAILGNGQVTPVVDLPELLRNRVKHQYLLTNATLGLDDDINGLPLALVVDDSLSARRSVAQLLQDSGFAVETAIDGLDAIKQIERVVPDLLVVDLEMPRMNGLELTAHIRGRPDMQQTPVIMITSRATEKHRQQAKAAGVSTFMTKPFSEDELINNTRAVLET